jgi:hypothetical protein
VGVSWEDGETSPCCLVHPAMAAFTRTIVLLGRPIILLRDMGGVCRRQKWLRDEEGRRVRLVEGGKGRGEGTVEVVAKGTWKLQHFVVGLAHGRQMGLRRPATALCAAGW